mmetsp:Transcript_7690/g.26009  ORF Transcript_7690/g.26009 Transcript_7690/m.26009 type:complete len:358 (-) Transcript_7690:221-1294(-)
MDEADGWQSRVDVVTSRCRRGQQGLLCSSCVRVRGEEWLQVLPVHTSYPRPWRAAWMLCLLLQQCEICHISPGPLVPKEVKGFDWETCAADHSRGSGANCSEATGHVPTQRRAGKLGGAGHVDDKGPQVRSSHLRARSVHGALDHLLPTGSPSLLSLQSHQRHSHPRQEARVPQRLRQLGGGDRPLPRHSRHQPSIWPRPHQQVPGSPSACRDAPLGPRGGAWGHSRAAGVEEAEPEREKCGTERHLLCEVPQLGAEFPLGLPLHGHGRSLRQAPERVRAGPQLRPLLLPRQRVARMVCARQKRHDPRGSRHHPRARFPQAGLAAGDQLKPPEPHSHAAQDRQELGDAVCGRGRMAT